MSSGPERDGDFVQSLERGLAVIRAFDADHAALTLSDVARLTGLTRATALRGRDGRALAALNCSTHAGRVGLRELRSEFVPVLLATAADINARLAKR